MRALRCTVLSVFLAGAQAAVGPVAATTISYSATHLSGATWQYSYSVANDTLAVDIREFTVFFGVGLYENLAFPGAPADWDPFVAQPDAGLPADGFYDALALASGIAPGNVLGGFTVQFDFLGGGVPGAQPFDIVDPDTLNPDGSVVALDSGLTVPAAAAVAAPGTFPLLALGIVGFVLAGRASRACRNQGARPQ